MMSRIRFVDGGIEAEEEPAEGGDHRAEEDCLRSLHDPGGCGGEAWPGRDGRCEHLSGHGTIGRSGVKDPVQRRHTKSWRKYFEGLSKRLF